jgi:hypothetical protein
MPVQPSRQQAGLVGRRDQVLLPYHGTRGRIHLKDAELLTVPEVQAQSIIGEWYGNFHS